MLLSVFRPGGDYDSDDLKIHNIQADCLLFSPYALLYQDLHLLLHLPQLLLQLQQLPFSLVFRVVVLAICCAGVVFHKTS